MGPTGLRVAARLDTQGGCAGIYGHFCRNRRHDGPSALLRQRLSRMISAVAGAMRLRGIRQRGAPTKRGTCLRKMHRKGIVQITKARPQLRVPLICMLAVASAQVCFAQVQLPAVNLGDTNYEHGFGAPGWLLEEFPAGYTASVLKDAHGNTVPGPNRVTTYSTTTHIALISKQRFLGAWLVTEALQPLVDLDLTLASRADSRIRGSGDLTVGSG